MRDWNIIKNIIGKIKGGKMVYGDEYNDIIDKILKKLEEALDQERYESDIESQDALKKKDE
tara:strand:+ start:937 stop:1119 length:183 start_codon:yes stop_codon:yes gene_type:complete